VILLIDGIDETVKHGCDKKHGQIGGQLLDVVRLRIISSVEGR
jgi:hypothetical protein